VAIGDLNGDSISDLAVADSKTLSVFVFHGKGDGGFDPPAALKTNGTPAALALADLNGDRRLDLTTTSSSARSASIFLNESPQGFAGQLSYGLGITPASHRLLDLDGDGAHDLVAFSNASAVVLFGRLSNTLRFVRGDVDSDGQILITDAILILDRLFLGGDTLPCEKAADADDDGALVLTDPILILGRLFLGDAELPPPGPGCGEDRTPDPFTCDTSCPP